MRIRPFVVVLLSWSCLTTWTTMAQEPPAETALPAFLPEGRSTAFLGVVSRTEEEGAKIQRVVPDSSAWKLGLEAGDVIQAIDGFQVGVINGATYSLPSEIRRSGDEVELRIRDTRTGDVAQRTVRVGGRATNKGSLDTTPRLGVTSNVSRAGETIVQVSPQSPAKAANLRSGDIVTFVDGYRVGIIDGNVYSLASEIRHSAGQCSLTIQRNGQTLQVPVEFTQRPITSATRVHLLLIGLTLDGRIGKGCEGNLRMLNDVLEPVTDEYRASFRQIDGVDCTAPNILQAIRALQVAPGEAVFCYYAGHGAYDSRQTNRDDPSGGHFFQIPSGDLLRKTVNDELRAKNAKLTVFISDTCNAPAVPELFGRAPGQPQFAEPPIRTLLLRYRGVVDISGSSRGQFGWFTQRSGIFTSALVQSVDLGGGTWSGLLDRAREMTQQEYRSIKEATLANPGNMTRDDIERMRNQQTQAPQAFQLDVTLE